MPNGEEKSSGRAHANSMKSHSKSSHIITETPILEQDLKRDDVDVTTNFGKNDWMCGLTTGGEVAYKSLLNVSQANNYRQSATLTV